MKGRYEIEMEMARDVLPRAGPQLIWSERFRSEAMAEDLRSDHLYSVNCGSESKPPSIALQILTGKTPSYILQNEPLSVSRTPPPAHSGLSPSRMGRSPSPAQRPNSRGSIPSRPPSLVHQEILQSSSGLPINLSRPNSRGHRLTPSPSQMQPPGIPVLQGEGLICHPPRVPGEPQLLQVPLSGVFAAGRLSPITATSSLAQALIAHERLSPAMSMPGHIVPTTTVSTPPLRITTPTPPPQISVVPSQPQRIQVHRVGHSTVRESSTRDTGPRKHASQALAQLLKMKNVKQAEPIVKLEHIDRIQLQQQQHTPVIKPRFEAVGLVQKAENTGHSSVSVTGLGPLGPNGPPPHLVPVAPRFTGEVPKLTCDAAAVPCGQAKEEEEEKKHNPEILPEQPRMPRLIRQTDIDDCEKKPWFSIGNDVKGPEILTESERQNLKKEEEEDNDDHDTKALEKPFNMRVMNLNHFPSIQTGYRATYRSHSVAIHRAKAGSICNTAKSLDLLRQNLQKHINKELDTVIQRYIDKYFKMGMDNIRLNNGDNSVSPEHLLNVSRQILEEAKKMYACETRSTTPDISDNVSDSGSLVENTTVRAAKLNLFPGIKKRRGSSDSDVSIPKRKKKGRPPIHTQGVSGRSTPNKHKGEPVRREGEKWDPERLKLDTLFVMGARANKALGLGATRGRLYIKHPDIFKYGGDQDDKSWLFESRHMPATGGKAYLLLVEDIRELAQTDEYRNSPGLMLDEIQGFNVPEWMLSKMKIQMQAMRTDINRPPKTKARTVMPNFPLATDSEDRLPFSFNGDNNNKEASDSKSDTQPSPANTENMDLVSMGHEDDDTPIVSPFNMTGGFECDVSPAAVSPAPSDLDTLEEDAGLSTTPFQLQCSE